MKNFQKIFSMLSLFLLGLATASADNDEIIITNLQGGTYLMKGNTYIVKDSIGYNMQEKGFTGPAVKIAENTTATLILQADAKFYLWGSNAREGVPAYPAIELPESSTLIIKGDGKLFVHGGSGLHKTDGARGGNGYTDYGALTHIQEYYTGLGGKGGRGSYGNATGIGTPGGIGGDAGNASTERYASTRQEINKAGAPSYKGGDGGKGGSSTNMGQLYILGNVYIESYVGGLAYPQYSNVAEVSADAGGYWTCGGALEDYFSLAAGGGGGNGGTCYSVNYAFGAGSPGAGGGGGGGSGGTDRQYYHKYFDMYPGYGGIGGAGDLRNGADGKRGYQRRYNGNGGKAGLAGLAGTRGNNGWVFYGPNVAFETYPSLTAPKDYIFNLKTVDEAHSTNLEKISYRELLDRHKSVLNHMHGASTVNNQGEPAFYHGMKLTGFIPDVEVPSAHGNTYFKGYCDQYGNQVFNEKGQLSIELEKYAPADGMTKNTKVYIKDSQDKWYVDVYRDIKLYAVWKDSVTVIVRHIIEDPECMDGDHQSCFSSDRSLVITESKRFGFDHKELVKIKSSAFCDLDGKSIEALNFSDKRLFLPVGAAETKEVTLDKEQVVIEHLYLRKSFQLTWDYTAFTEDEIKANMTNEANYTKAGMVKYGKALVCPELKPIRGKVISGWTPDLTDEMPPAGLTMKASIKDLSFNVTDDVYRGSTACSLKLSSTSANYGQTVTIDVTLEEATHLANLDVTTQSDHSKVHVTKVNDTQYSFVMPNDHVTISGEFVLTKSHVVNIQSTEDAHFALYDNDNQKLYTDDTDFFDITPTDKTYGGPLKDFEVYKSKQIGIVAMLDQTESTKALRPTVSINRMGSDIDEHTTISRRLINGCERKVFSYYAKDASDLTINVQWSKKTAKEITLLNALGTRFSTISSDVQDDIKCTLSTGKPGAMAYADDYITFEVSTKDAAFNTDNIFAWYLDASTRQIPVEISVDKDSLKANNFICRYQMPDRDMTIKLELGRKVPINVMLPDEDYGFYAPDSAVVGSVIPFGVVVRHDPEGEKKLQMIKHPLGLYNQGHEAVLPEGFGEVQTTRTDCEYSFGTFVVPDADNFVIANGILLHPQLYNDWFTFYCDEELTMPDNVEIFDICLDEENQLELQTHNSQEVMAMEPVLCHLNREYMGTDSVLDTLSLFLPINPNASGDYWPSTSKGGYIGGSIDSVDCVTLMEKCTMGEQIYRLDYDIDNQVPFFHVAEKDFQFGANTVYLRLNKSQEPVYPTGIYTMTSDQDKYSAPVYNLLGMPVDSYYKGIVIKKSKKISIR